MPRIQMPLRPIQIDYVCDKCQKGKYRSTGTMLLSSPPQFPHECTECKDSRIFWEKYPTIRYVCEGDLLDFDYYKEQYQ